MYAFAIDTKNPSSKINNNKPNVEEQLELMYTTKL